jgi:hypothetical protein
VIAAGSASATLTVTPIDDTVSEGDETVTVTLSPSASYNVGSPSTATVTIADNDPPAGPSLSVSPMTIAPGGTVTASWSGIVSPSSTDWIGLYTPGAANASFIDWLYVSCSKTPGTARASGSCSFTLPTTLSPGTYQLRLLANDGFTVLATSSSFTVTAPGGPSLTESPTTIARGGAVTATWSGIVSPSATDWIGFYTPGAGNTSFLNWIYVSCSQTAASPRASGSCPFTVPASVAPGMYQLRLLSNDGFSLLATSNNFTVQ